MFKKIIIVIAVLCISPYVWAAPVMERLEKAHTLIGQGSYKEALEICEGLEDVASGNPDLHEYLGYCRYKLGDYTNAIDDFKKAISLQPDRASSYKYLGYAYYHKGDREDALRAARTSVRLDPTDSKAHFSLGFILYMAKDYRGAERSLRNAARLTANKAEPLYYLGRALEYQRRYKEAIEEERAVIEGFPGDYYVPYAKLAAAYAYCQERDFDSAAALYDEAANERPDLTEDEHTIFWRAVSSYKIEHYEKAEKLFFRHLADFPKSKYVSRIHYELALAYAEQGKIGPAMQHFGRLAPRFYIGIIVYILILSIIVATVVLLTLIFTKSRKPQEGAEKTQQGIFAVWELILVAMGSFLLPISLAPLMGLVLFGEPLIGFLVSPKVLPCIYVYAASYLVGHTAIAAFIFLRIVKRHDWVKKFLRPPDKKLVTCLTFPLGLVIVYIGFGYVYEYLVERVLHIQIPPHFMDLIIRSIKTDAELIIMFFFAVVFIPILEEIIMRLFIYTGLRSFFGVKAGIYISALIFAVYHLEPTYFIPIFVVGIMLAALYEKTKSLMPPIITHMFINLSFFLLTYFFPDIV